MTTITCKLPRELDEQLEAMAYERHVSKSAIVREALEENVKRLRRRRANGKKPLTLYDVMKDACGIIKDAPRDYATNPKYLKGFGR